PAPPPASGCPPDLPPVSLGGALLPGFPRGGGGGRQQRQDGAAAGSPQGHQADGREAGPADLLAGDEGLHPRRHRGGPAQRQDPAVQGGLPGSFCLPKTAPHVASWSPFCKFVTWALSTRGYDRYYNKYINVRKGGLGGITMVLAGYIVISYIWSYDHLKHDRHRKYH
uniref:ATP synthase F(0) complex subunit f, mitochondrial n=1 Tax=Apteryx owenii TaxID=8824 RepID=A0A8B9QBJ3_APTOW